MVTRSTAPSLCVYSAWRGGGASLLAAFAAAFAAFAFAFAFAAAAAAAAALPLGLPLPLPFVLPLLEAAPDLDVKPDRCPRCRLLLLLLPQLAFEALAPVEAKPALLLRPFDRSRCRGC